MKKRLLFLLISLLPLLGIGATTLVAGDLVILEFNGNGSDGFTFMPLVDLTPGTVINFTDYGWNATTSSFNIYEEGNPPTGGGNMITYTAPSAVTAGTLIRQNTANVGGSAFTANSNWLYNFNNTNYIYALNALTTGHDGIQVFQGLPSSPTFIWGYHTGQWGKGAYSDNYWSDLPTGLTNGTNAVYFVDNNAWTDVTVDDGFYSGPTTSATADVWRTRVANSANWTTSATGTAPALLYPNSYTVTSTITPPTVTTQAVSSLTTIGATLNGSINANNASTVVSFDYGLTTSYGTSVTATQSPVTSTTTTAVSAVLTGLVPNTTYHFRVKGVNTAGTTNGTDLTFTTTAAVPTATTSAATSITTTGATLNGSINTNNATTVVTFDYGTTTSYGTNVTATQSPVTGTTTTAVSAVLTGLVPNATYHFRVNGVNTAGTTNGTDLTFTTTAAVPTANTSAATLITSTGATLNGTINANNASTVVSFEYGLTTSYGTSVTATQSPVTGTTTTAVSAVLTGLVPNTTYHFRVKGVNTAGTTNGTDLTFTTDNATRLNNIEENSLSIYPNPAIDFITIITTENKYRVNIYNTDGILLFSQDVKGNKLINISSLQSGIYVVKYNGVSVKLVKK